MTEDRSLERAIETLRADARGPVDLAPGVLDRIRAELRPGRRPPRQLRPLTWVATGVAAAAALTVAVRSALHPAPAPSAVNVSFERPVAFQIDETGASQVSLVGDFNNWDRRAIPMTRDRGGQWRATLSLTSGTYRYAFLVDDSRWVPDPRQMAPVDRDFGEPTSLVTVQ